MISAGGKLGKVEENSIRLIVELNLIAKIPTHQIEEIDLQRSGIMRSPTLNLQLSECWVRVYSECLFSLYFLNLENPVYRHSKAVKCWLGSITGIHHHFNFSTLPNLHTSNYLYCEEYPLPLL